jgi:hypothetical protein
MVYDYFYVIRRGGGFRWLVGRWLNKLCTKIRIGGVVGRPSLLFSVVIRLNIEY